MKKLHNWYFTPKNLLLCGDYKIGDCYVYLRNIKIISIEKSANTLFFANVIINKKKILLQLDFNLMDLYFQTKYKQEIYTQLSEASGN